jgi:23S rRNA (cytosine1962-C5)-methyltransferase
MEYPKVIIRKGREKSLERFHPWVFSGSIESAERNLMDGEVVQLIDHDGKFLGVGHCSSSSISVKVLSFEEVVIDDKWFLKTIKSIAKSKLSMGFPSESTNAYRLIHGEGDGMPGLIIDIYNDVAVIQCHSEGMEQSLKPIVKALKAIGLKNIVHKPMDKSQSKVLSGEVGERIVVLENGMKLNVDVLLGQKTGFFLDQRDNRALVCQYAKGKTVLNVFSYTGGFSVAALLGGAKSAISLDSAANALGVANENAALNDVGDSHQILKTDAVPYLEVLSEKYDIVVLDPPAFAKHKSARHNAIQAYRRINEAALRNINSGGMLFTFSCSQVVDRQMFYDTIASAAINAGRKVRVLHHLRQPADHPVSIFHPEGEYLKGLVLQVD